MRAFGKIIQIEKTNRKMEIDGGKWNEREGGKNEGGEDLWV